MFLTLFVTLSYYLTLKHLTLKSDVFDTYNIIYIYLMQLLPPSNNQ